MARSTEGGIEVGELVKVNVTDKAWTILFGLEKPNRYSFQNVSGESMFLREGTALPPITDTGKELMPYRSATLIVENSAFLVRMKSGTGVAYYNQFQ